MSGVVLLAGRGRSTNVVFNALERAMGVDQAIIEQPRDQRSFLRARVRKLGPVTVMGQVLFRALVVPPLRMGASARVQEILETNDLDETPIPPDRRVDVSSVNDDETHAWLERLQPKVVVINGTRIVGKRTLAAVSATFINMHVGITPAYRGVHGGYWSLVEGESNRCGVTVHVVDAGIDTGGIIAQALIQPTARDNFTTYPILQLAAGLPLLEMAVRDVLEGRLALQPNPSGPSKLWSHPTLGQYVWYRISKGVR